MDSPASNVVNARSGSVREIVTFSGPLIISNLSLSAMWVVDTLIMGHVGTVEQGAVGLGGILTWAVMCFFAGTMTVVNILVAQDYGAGRKDVARHVRTGFVVLVPLACLMLSLWFLVPAALGWLGASAAVRPFAQVYMQIRLLSAPLVLGSFVLVSYLRGTGDTITPMVVSLLANVLNALLALVLVFGWFGIRRMGVTGAALATAIAGTAEFGMYLSVFVFGRAAKLYGARTIRRPAARELRQFLALGAPLGLSWLFETIAWSAFSAYAGTRAPVELAAHMILFQVTGLCFMPAAAFGIAASTLVGQYLGARRKDLASKSAYRALAIGVGYMTLVGLLLALLRRPLLQAFNPDPSVVAMGCTLALIGAAYQPFDGFGIICQGIVRGAGLTAIPTWVMLGSGGLVFIPAVIVLGERMGLGVRGAWIAALLHVVVVSIVLGAIVFRGRWKHAVPLSEMGGATVTPRAST